MALVLKDRVKQTAAAPGTGTITLGATAAGFQSFASVGNGNTTYFAIVDPISGDWEVNYGVYTSSGTTLTRNATPLSSSTGTLVNFTGAVDVFLTYPSEKAVWQDLSGVVAQQSFGAITATSAALTSGTITTAPVNATDIVNKEYADSIASGLNYHQPVNYASTAALPAYTYSNGTGGVNATITANANGALSLGGGSPTATQRVLIKDEVSGNAPYNGVYVVTQAGSAGTPFILTRATDYDTSGTGTNEIDQGDYVLVISGTLASTAWVQQTPLPITVGTTALTFLQFNAPITYTAGTGLNLSPATTFNISNTGVTASTYGSASAVPVFAVNAQGQITSVTNTNIAISGSAVSGNISGSAGSVANSLTLGTYLTGGTYNGSAAVTATVDATSANTASKVVARDSSGNFSAGTITATLSGSATSATTATNLAGGAANQIAYQSASGTTSFATAPSASNQVLNWNGSAFTWSAGTISGVPLGSNLNSLTAGTYLTGTAYNGSAAQTWTVDATSANTASKVVARDASGDFSAGTITASLSGNATSATNSTTTSQRAFSGDISTTGQGRFTGWYSGNAATGLGVEAGISSGEGYVIAFDRTTSTYGALNIQTSSASLRLSGSTVNVSTGALQQGGSQVLTAANYNSYAPTLTGTGASGTWNINVTGSAGSAGSASSVPWTGVSAGTRTNYTLGFQPSGSDYAGFYFQTSAGNGAGYFLIKGVSDNFGPYTAEGITLVSDANSLNLFARGSSLVAGGNAWVRMGTGTSETFRLMSDYSYSLNSSRAPIFYDSDNTSYYVDPNSNSRLVNLGLGGVTPDVRLSVSGDVHLSSNLYLGGTAGSAGSWSARMYSSGGATYINTSTFTVDRTGYGGGGSFSMDTGGNSYASTSFRAPIFYDSDNTGYYVDPASISNLVTVNTQNAVSNITGGLRNVMPNGGAFTTSASTVSGAIKITLPTTNYPMVRFTVKVYTYDGLSFDINCGGHTSSGIWYNTFAWMATQHRSAMNVRFTYGGGQTFVYIGDLGSSWTYPQVFITDVQVGYSTYDYSQWDDGWSITFDASTYNNVSATHTVYPPTSTSNNTNPAYASIYYDANDTGYYLDPNSTSNSALRIRGGALHGPNPTWGAYLYVGTDGNASGTATVCTTDGNIHIDASNSSHGIYLGYYTGDYTRIYNSTRSPIFYDLDNTSYYLDPASSSVLNTIYQVGVYTRNSAGTGYLSGNYASSETASTTGAIYTIGGSYYPTSSSFNTMYGIGYCYADGISVGITGASGWGMYVNASGVNNVWLGGYNGAVISTGDHRGTIFYDYNNTGYYVDPASTSILNVLNCYGNVTAYYSSDIKFKTNVRNIPNAIETVESIGGKLFDWTDEYLEEHGGEDPYFMRKEDFGVVAQDVLKVFPVAVRTRPDGSLAVDYEKLSALAFAAVAELSTRVKSLEARI